MAAFANGSCRRPPHPSSETSRTIPSRNRERWRNSPPGGWAPGLRHPLASPRPPEGTRSRFLKQHLQVPSDIAGSGGAPRQATAWEAEARIHAGLLCRDREHGGTQAVSRRAGSPREARSEGPKVLSPPSPSVDRALKGYGGHAMRKRPVVLVTRKVPEAVEDRQRHARDARRHGLPGSGQPRRHLRRPRSARPGRLTRG